MQLLGKMVMILPDKMPERTKTGLLIPAIAKEKPEEGTVVQVGLICKEVKPGMRVIFPRKNASVVVIDDVDYYVISEDRLIFIYENE